MSLLQIWIKILYYLYPVQSFTNRIFAHMNHCIIATSIAVMDLPNLFLHTSNLCHHTQVFLAPNSTELLVRRVPT